MDSKEKELYRTASRLARKLEGSLGGEDTAVDRVDAAVRAEQVLALGSVPGTLPAITPSPPQFTLNAGKSAEQASEAQDSEDILQSAGFKLEGKGSWGVVPTVVVQYIDPRFSGTWRESAVKTRQFTLANQVETDELDALMARSEPITAPGFGRSDTDAEGNRLALLPGIVEEYSKTEFSPNIASYVTVVAYREIYYKRLLEIF